jgi:hypothetical protein
MTMNSEILAHVDRLSVINSGQMSRTEYEHVATVITRRTPCNLLVFGVGNDTDLWLAANRCGRTVFLENSAQWIERVRTRFGEPSPDIRLCSYAPRLLQLIALMNPTRLVDGIPEGLDAVPWDVILVDAPWGYRPWHPGRLQAIAWAAHLARPDRPTAGGQRPVDVFVHDFDRRTERHGSTMLLGQQNLDSVIGRLAHFRIS